MVKVGDVFILESIFNERVPGRVINTGIYYRTYTFQNLRNTKDSITMGEKLFQSVVRQPTEVEQVLYNAKTLKGEL